MHDIACALEPLLFPEGIPEDLDIPMLLRALADLMERDGEAAARRQADTGAGCSAAGQEAPPAAATPAENDSGPKQDCAYEQSKSQIATQITTENTAEQPAIQAAASPEEQSEEARQALRHALLRVRGMLGPLCGPQALRRYGLDGRVPEEPARLLVFARRTVRLLERAELGASQPAPFVTVDLAGAAACLRDHVDALEAQLSPEPESPAAKGPEPGSTPGGAGGAASTEGGTRERARRWTPDAQAAASIAEGLLRLAHMEERADLVRALRSARAAAARRGTQARSSKPQAAAGVEPPAAC